jgi:hypothetical protein
VNQDWLGDWIWRAKCESGRVDAHIRGGTASVGGFGAGNGGGSVLLLRVWANFESRCTSCRLKPPKTAWIRGLSLQDVHLDWHTRPYHRQTLSLRLSLAGKRYPWPTCRSAPLTHAEAGAPAGPHCRHRPQMKDITTGQAAKKRAEPGCRRRESFWLKPDRGNGQ